MSKNRTSAFGLSSLLSLPPILGSVFLFIAGGLDSSHAAITVDGVKDADYGSPLSVQTVPAGWGGNNTLASLSAVQQGSALYVFLAGRPQGNAFILFIDSKPGGISFIPNNLISGGGDEYCINNFGSSSSAGMTFESGFQPDYAIRVYGDGGGGSGAWASLYSLVSGSSRVYLGNSGAEDAAGAPVTKLRTTWQTITDVTTADTGSEIQLNMAQLGIPSGTGQTVKFMVMLVNGGSDYGSNQVLGSLPAGSGDLGGNMKTTDFGTVADAQTISMTVDNADMDQDGIPDSQDPDIDGDGLANELETNTGIFVDATHTGTNPYDADSDDDGVNDGTEVNVNLTNPLKVNYATMTVAGDFQGWSPSPAADNTMTKVAGQEFAWTLNYRFSQLTNTIGKFTAGSWAKNWGTNASTVSTGKLAMGGGDLALNVTSTGFWTFAFNNDTLDYSFARTVFPDYAAFATAYGLTGTEADDFDADGISNGAEFAANTDPTRTNDATPPVITLNGNGLVAVALNATYTDAGATATDNVDATVTVNSTGTVDTSVVGSYTITYSASDAANNAAATKSRTVLVYDPAVGFASRFTSVTVPGNYTSPGIWDVSGNQGNAMTQVGNFKWRLAYEFTSARAIEYKVVGGADWASTYQWGVGGALGAGNATANVIAGLYYFELDEVLNTTSLTRVGSTFVGWSGGAPLTPETLTAYAIGGASSLTATDGQASEVGGDATTLTLTAIVRSDDTSLTIAGEASTDLSTGWSSTGVSVSNAASQAGVPQGCTRKVFSVSRGSEDKKFIRIKATK